jgi:hypothetical protein
MTPLSTPTCRQHAPRRRGTPRSDSARPAVQRITRNFIRATRDKRMSASQRRLSRTPSLLARATDTCHGAFHRHYDTNGLRLGSSRPSSVWNVVAAVGCDSTVLDGPVAGAAAPTPSNSASAGGHTALAPPPLPTAESSDGAGGCTGRHETETAARCRHTTRTAERM